VSFTASWGKPYADGSIGLLFFSKGVFRPTLRIAQFSIPLAIELIEKPPTHLPVTRATKARMSARGFFERRFAGPTSNYLAQN
jgi:hypothetical protein